MDRHPFEQLYVHYLATTGVDEFSDEGAQALALFRYTLLPHYDFYLEAFQQYMLQDYMEDLGLEDLGLRFEHGELLDDDSLGYIRDVLLVDFFDSFVSQLDPNIVFQRTPREKKKNTTKRDEYGEKIRAYAEKKSYAPLNLWQQLKRWDNNVYGAYSQEECCASRHRQHCGEKFATKRDLAKHIKDSHVGDGSCVECGAKLKQKATRCLKCSKPHECSRCERRFETTRRLADHERSSHVNRVGEFKCPLCAKKKFKSVKSLDQHYFSFHFPAARYVAIRCYACRVAGDGGQPYFESSSAYVSHVLRSHRVAVTHWVEGDRVSKRKKRNRPTRNGRVGRYRGNHAVVTTQCPKCPGAKFLSVADFHLHAWHNHFQHAAKQRGLPKNRYRSIEDAENHGATQCSICLEGFSETDVVQKLKCDHFFHPHCIQRWFKSNSNCPVCRRIFEAGRIEELRESQRKRFSAMRAELLKNQLATKRGARASADKPSAARD